MRFKEVIGQQEVKRHLIEMMQSNRLAHALLFLGKEGSGALPLALAFSQYVVCEKANKKLQQNPNPFSTDYITRSFVQVKEKEVLTDSCGQCAACLKANQLVHPDIHFSYPTIKKTTKSDEKPISTEFVVQWRDFIKYTPYGNDKDWVDFIKENVRIENPINKQGNITAEECNDIIHKMYLKSFEAEYKVLIMWMPELMTALGQGNKLLKLIEEPPPNTLFILVAENESLVLPTIVSRCQLIKIPELEIKDIEEALINRNNTEPAIARQVAGISDGNYREALQLVQHAEEDWQSLLREWLNAILKTGPIAQTKWVEEIGRLGREKQKQFLRYFNHLLEQAVRLRTIADASTLLGADGIKASAFLDTIPEKEKDFAERLNKIAGIEQQQAIIEELDKASYYIERNAHGKMLFHALTIKLYHIIQDKVVFLTD